MSAGILFGAFWFGLGVLMWWWPAAIFVAFSNDDVTPGARAFAVGAIFFGTFFLTASVPILGARFALPGTVLTVGVLLVVKPVPVLGTDPDGPLTPKKAGIASILAGLVLAVQAVA